MEKTIIKVETRGFAETGVDYSSLDENISAEIKSYSENLNAQITRSDFPAPDGSQGVSLAVEWIIEYLKDPEMAKIYAGILIYALNKILDTHSPKKAKIEEKDENKKNKTTIEVTVFNKSILLPVATQVIKEFLESIGAK